MLPRLLSPGFLDFLGFAGCVGTDYINDPLGGEAARIEVSPLDAAVAQSQTTRLQATYFDADGLTSACTLFVQSGDVRLQDPKPTLRVVAAVIAFPKPYRDRCPTARTTPPTSALKAMGKTTLLTSPRISLL